MGLLSGFSLSCLICEQTFCKRNNHDYQINQCPKKRLISFLAFQVCQYSTRRNMMLSREVGTLRGGGPRRRRRKVKRSLTKSSCGAVSLAHLLGIPTIPQNNSPVCTITFLLSSGTPASSMITSTLSLSLSAQGPRHPSLSSPLLLVLDVGSLKQSFPSFDTDPWNVSNDFPFLFFVDGLSLKSRVRYCLVIEQHLYCKRRASLNHVLMCMSTHTVV